MILSVNIHRSDSRKGPLTRIAARSDLSPHGGERCANLPTQKPYFAARARPPGRRETSSGLTQVGPVQPFSS
jgi:hypothetical protein